jgi:hypothetical protein
MKKFIILPMIFLFLNSTIGKSQVLNVPETFQEQNQWCWAGCSKCILDYYGDVLNQCDIADYARTQITWTSFGTVNCCVDPNQGCNYWNYNYGSNGSIQDILVHFGAIANYGVASALTLAEINSDISGNKPFVIRWGWTAGGGHFIVGHGINGTNVNYMNPWPGEGLHVGDYTWMVSDGTHNWTHTNRLTTSPNGINPIASTNENANVFPNPASDHFTVSISSEIILQDAELVLTDVTGREVMRSKIQNSETEFSTVELSDGVYFYQLINSESIIGNGKLVVQ